MAPLLFLSILVTLAFGQQTICEKYAKAKGLTQVNLMTAIVTEVVNTELANPQIKPFFDGTLPAGSTNFTAPANKAKYDKLAGGLVAFFGNALGCTDPTFPKYMGADMRSIHAPMPIGRNEFDTFNNNFITALTKLGVDAADRTTIRGFLDSFAGDIVNPTVICSKYAKALKLTQLDLMKTIVNKVVTAEVSNPTILPFFNGTLPAGSKNIVGSPTEVTRVSNGLIAFFGGALGCNEAGFPKYTGADMKTVHANMPIGRTEFVLFNDIFIKALSDLGVDNGDQLTVRGILDSFASRLINPQIICKKYATALKVTQLDLMKTIVTNVVNAEVADTAILPFFNGTLPAGSKNIVASPTEVTRVSNGLISFFGGALGCNEAGFPKYTGADMKTVHSKMPISAVETKKFNDIFITTVGKLGVDSGDQVTIRQLLDGFNNQIVNPSYICPKYAKALGITQVKLMQTIVTEVLNREVADPDIKIYFNGTKPEGSKNILADADQVNRLSGGLVAFFGAALGCNEAGFPKYTGPADMKALHGPMKISFAAFTKFNDIFISALASLNVAPADRAVVRALLDSTQSAIVDTPASGSSGDPDLVAKGYTLNQPLDCGITVYWMPINTDPQPADRVVKFAVRRTTTGYVALGFPANNEFRMVGSDAVIGWVRPDGSISVNAYLLASKRSSDVIPNDMLNVTEVAGTEVDGVTTIYFTRLLMKGYNPITDLTKVTVIASTHDSADSIQQHSCRISSAYDLDLATGSGSAGAAGNTKLRNAHGILMMIGWGFFLIIGVLVARYGKGALKDGLWFKVHQVLQILGLCLTTSGLIVAFVMVDGYHWNTAFHGQLGLTIMILAYLQMLGGFLRPHKEDGEEATGARKIFELVHPNVGRLLLITASVNIFAGIETIRRNYPENGWGWWVHLIYALLVAFYIVAIAGGELSGAAKGGSSGSPDYYAMN